MLRSLLTGLALCLPLTALAQEQTPAVPAKPLAVAPAGTAEKPADPAAAKAAATQPAEASAPPAAPATSDYLPALFDVTVVETWDTLNVREAPDGQAKIIGTLPATAKGVELLARDGSGKWGRVNVGEASGWVALRFLKPQKPVWKPAALPLSLKCSGTEPFWSVRTVDKGLVLAEPEQPDRQLTLRKVMDRGIEGEPSRGLIAGDDKGRLTAFLRPEACSDGMSDRSFALAVSVILDGQDMPSRLLTGCCSIAP